MSNEQDNKNADNVVDMGLFRMKREIDAAESETAQENTPVIDGNNDQQAETDDPSDPPFDLFYDLLSIEAISPENMPVMMQNLLRSLNSQFALVSQRKSVAEGAGMYNAHIPVTNINLHRSAVVEIAENFAEILREHKPKAHYRIKQRVESEHKDAPETEREAALRETFKTEAVGYTPAYRDLVGKLKTVFPTATFKPSLVEVAEDSFLPCLCIDAPIGGGRDLRDYIKDYIDAQKRGPNGLKPV